MVSIANQRARSAAAVLYADRGDLLWLVRKSSRIGYLGWVRRGNLGDEAMFSGFARHVGNHLVRHVPITKVGRGLARIGSVDTLVVGGGTLLGLPEWTHRINRAIDVLQPRRIVAVGTGVINPEYEADKSAAKQTLKECTRLLSGFSDVLVRGPRSAETLRRFDISARPVGDLALLTESRRFPPSGKKTVLVNLVGGANRSAVVTGHRAGDLMVALARLQRQGFDVSFFGMERSDVELASKLAAGRFAVRGYRDDVDSLVAAISDASLVVSERLHGSILAASVGTPFVPIAYKDKVLDFAESVGAGDRVLRVDKDLTDTVLFDRMMGTAEDTSRQREIDTNVRAVRESLTLSMSSVLGVG